MFIRLPSRFGLLISFWRSPVTMLEEVVVDGEQTEAVIERLKIKYKDQPVKVLSQYMIQLDRDMVIVYRRED